MQILSKYVYIWLSAQGPVWPIADNICFDCKVNGGWPRPLLTYYEVNKILQNSSNMYQNNERLWQISYCHTHLPITEYMSLSRRAGEQPRFKRACALAKSRHSIRSSKIYKICRGWHHEQSIRPEKAMPRFHQKILGGSGYPKHRYFFIWSISSEKILGGLFYFFFLWKKNMHLKGNIFFSENLKKF